MNNSQLIKHQFKCEWLSFKWLVAVWAVAFSFCAWMLFSWNDPWRAYSDASIRQSEGIPFVIIGIFTLLFSIALYKRDDYRSETAFWQTRPIRETQLHLAKLIFFLAVVAIPATGLVFVNVWHYDSLGMAVFSSSEVLAWMILAMSIIALMMQHSGGIRSFIAPTNCIIFASLITVITIIMVNFWRKHISQLAYLHNDPSIELISYISLILLALTLLYFWLKQSRSRGARIGLKHYLCIPLIITTTYASRGLFYDTFTENAPESISIQPVEKSVTLSIEPYGRKGSVSLQFQGGGNEYLNRVFYQNLSCDDSAIHLAIYDSSTRADSNKFAPKKFVIGKTNLNQYAPVDFYEELYLSVSAESEATLPKQIKVTGYIYAELATADEVMNTPYKKAAKIQTKGMEYSWRQKTDYYNPDILYIKRTHLPLISYMYKHRLHKSPYSFCISYPQKNEFKAQMGNKSYARNHSSHRRRTFEFDSQNYSSSSFEENKTLKSQSHLHIFQFNSKRIVKIPVEFTLELK